MPDPASPPLSREQRRCLLDILSRLPQCQTPAGRDVLLHDLPPKLVDGLHRDTSKSIDLANIIEAARSWGPLADGTQALFVVFDNALFHNEGSQAANELQEFYDVLAMSPAPAPATQAVEPSEPAPPQTDPAQAEPKRRPPRLSSEEKVERYRALKKAIAEERWDLAQDLASRIRDMWDVPTLLHEARRGWARREEKLGALDRAYAQDDWAEIIRLSHQVGPEISPRVAEWIAHAWREVSVPVQELAGHMVPVYALVQRGENNRPVCNPRSAGFSLWGRPTG